MNVSKLAALVAVALLACAPVAAQNIATLPNAVTLAGGEKMTAAQGSGCPTKVQPCTIVAVSPAQIATYLAPTFQPKDADLTAIATLATQPFGRSLLTQADAASVQSYLGLAAVAASGLDTALLGTAWTIYTPTASVTSGALGGYTASGRYKRIGKTVFFAVRITITATGSAGGGVTFSLPFVAAGQTSAPVDRWYFGGREDNSMGFQLQGKIMANASTGEIVKYDNAYPGGNGYGLFVSGFYEAQ